MPYTETDHLKGKDPVVSRMYDALIRQLRHFGPVTIDPNKTSIHLVNRFAFAGVYTRRNYINLVIPLSRMLDSPRVARSEQASANRFHHTVKLALEKDIDAELLSWLKEAYVLKK